jgi:hypothetical protein
MSTPRYANAVSSGNVQYSRGTRGGRGFVSVPLACFWVQHGVFSFGFSSPRRPRVGVPFCSATCYCCCVALLRAIPTTSAPASSLPLPPPSIAAASFSALPSTLRPPFTHHTCACG